MSDLIDRFQEYGSWRAAVTQAFENFREAVDEHGLLDNDFTARCQRGLDLLRGDRLRIAFVAEFSRGKSELINALFFAGYGQRILPSSVGRTTMCPTELLYDENLPPSIRLLPIETRTMLHTGVLAPEQSQAYGVAAQAWTTLALDTSSADAMRECFHQLTLTKRVPLEQAIRLGLYHGPDHRTQHDKSAQQGQQYQEHGDSGNAGKNVGGGEGADIAEVAAEPAALVEIPCWRHAIVNFPHPLLRQGLVIIDTPGLNATGTEPELTLNLIPDAHGVLFMLCADTGVTRSDAEVWREHLSRPAFSVPAAASQPALVEALPQGEDAGHGFASGRMVVLNKIDAMWDSLRSQSEYEQQLAAQVADAAAMLGVPARDVFPVSAQRGLVAKISHDDALLERSCLPALERALYTRLIPARLDIMRSRLGVEIAELAASRQSLLQARHRNVIEQLLELRSLRGKNRGVLTHMLKRIDAERREFDGSLVELQVTRKVFSDLSAQVFKNLGMTALERHVLQTRHALASSNFSLGLHHTVRDFFSGVDHMLSDSARQIDEIAAMMEAAYRKFSSSFGLTLNLPMKFSLQGYRDELAEIERLQQLHFGARAMLTTSQNVLRQKFFETIAVRVAKSIKLANRDVHAWLRAIMAPLEAQLAEHKAQLSHRHASVVRIDAVAGQLEDSIAALEVQEIKLGASRSALREQVREVNRTLMSQVSWLRAAA